MDAVNSDKVIDSLDTAVVILDDTLLITGLNPAAENLLGISRHRARGTPLLPLVDDDETLKSVLARSLTDGLTYAHELHLGPNEVHTDNRIVDCRVTPLRKSSPAERLLVEMSDVTRRIRINRENALLIQHGAGRQMVRQLAHEIKNPLGGLRGAAQLLARELDSAELREYTSVIISEADRLVTLVDTLLGPGGPPHKEPVNIHELIEYVIRLIEPEKGERLRIVRDYDPGLPQIALDRDQIVQALLNLVQNASVALEGQGTLTLRTRATMNFTIGEIRHATIASIEVEDDGPGIPKDLQDSVFYPLVTSRADGTGLGLPVAQDLISRHGGLIEFDSRPGRTVFSVRLPIVLDGAVTDGAVADGAGGS
jgi:two-component system nitrogen regulation sensor histidine kinase GlnL